jgi:hypothetical protein
LALLKRDRRERDGQAERADHVEQGARGGDNRVEVAAQRILRFGEAVLQIDDEHRRPLAESYAAAYAATRVHRASVVQARRLGVQSGHVIVPSQTGGLSSRLVVFDLLYIKDSRRWSTEPLSGAVREWL